ncbi:MAG: hypothetical protein HYU77_14575 [Betaproteobacteria bacterium]|nr:hypothetical protein [Betaproteobacteria bacterium]
MKTVLAVPGIRQHRERSQARTLADIARAFRAWAARIGIRLFAAMEKHGERRARQRARVYYI